ncbi:MAG: phospholipase D family protein, partial [Gammaproteobacteria bacterium]
MEVWATLIAKTFPRPFSKAYAATRLIFIATLIPLLSACSSSPPRYQHTGNENSRVEAPTDLSCSQNDPTRCALRSPLTELGNRAYEDAKHFATLLNRGRESLHVRLNLIRAAQKSIDIQTFIWANDAAGKLLMRELVAAARRGVKVRILADQLRDEVTAEFLARLAVTHINLEKKLYNPFRGKAVMADMDYLWGTFFHFNALNHRMHGKLMVVDGKISIVGGRNVQNRYFDLDPDFDFIDREVIVFGPTVDQMQASFEDYWQSPIVARIDQLDDVRRVLFNHRNRSAIEPLDHGDIDEFGETMHSAHDYEYVRKTFVDTAFEVNRIQFTADRPMKPFVKDVATDLDTSAVLRQVVGSAKQSLLVQTPYPILSSSAGKILRKVRKQHPGIEFTLSTNSLASADHAFVYALAFKRKKRTVDELGVNIYELRNDPAEAHLFVPDYPALSAKRQRRPQTAATMVRTLGDTMSNLFVQESLGPRLSIHAKSLVVDERIAVIGSHNFDPRSRDINTENAVIIWDHAVAKALATEIRLATKPQNSWLVAKAEKVPLIGYFSDAIALVSRALPIFDLWPFRWTSSFELRPGKKAVSRNHPDFYQNYRDVGQFPNMGLGLK